MDWVSAGCRVPETAGPYCARGRSIAFSLARRVRHATTPVIAALVVAGAAVAASGGLASAVELVRVEKVWPHIEGDCSTPATAFFTVDGPAFVEVFLEIDPYRSAGRIMWITTKWSELNRQGELLGWENGFGPGIASVTAKVLQQGQEVRNFVEGVPLIVEQRLHFVEDREYRYGALLSPPCDTSSNLNRKDQASQRATLVLRYGAGSGPGDNAVAGLAGLWSIVANGAPGSLELTREDDDWHGTVNFGYGTEELADIVHDSATGEVTFTRPGAGQRFRGILTPQGLEGRFDQDGAGDYVWQGTRPGTTPAGYLDAPGEPVDSGIVTTPGGARAGDEESAVDDGVAIEGTWRIDAIGYRGLIEFVRSGGVWTGRENIDGAWEPVVDVVHDSERGVVEFTRPRVAQRYRGRISADGLSGKFDQGGAGSYDWSAVR